MSNQRRRYLQVSGGSHDFPFSDGVFIGDTLYLSGRIGLDPVTRRPPADVKEEIRLLLDGFRETLAAANLTMNDLVFVQVFCSDVSLFDTFNAAYRTYFRKPFPARAFLGSGPLLFGARFEMQGIAVRSGRKKAKR